MEPPGDDQTFSNARPVLGRGSGSEGLRRPRFVSDQAPQSSPVTAQWPAGQMRRPNFSGQELEDLTTLMMNTGLNQEQEDVQTFYNNFNGAGDVRNTQDWADTHHPPAQTFTRLNPNAPNFVPRAFVPFPTQVQETNDYHPSYPPNGSYYDEPGGGDQQFGVAGGNEDDDFIALRCLREFIDEISFKPNKYESNLAYLTDAINNWIDEDPVVMSSIVNMIVDQAIVDTQFRYNGVRLCIHLMNVLRPNKYSTDETFKNLLFQRCQRESARCESLAISSQTETYLRGLTLFIGDLFSRCGAPALADCLPSLLDTLVKHSNSDNLKCVCQVLKLCGLKLEEHYKSKGSKEVEDVMAKLSSHSNNNEVSPYTRELITNVVEMQKHGWTAAVPTKNSASTSTKNPYLEKNSSNDICGPAGESDSYSDEDEYGTGYDFGPCGDEEDKDVCEAFEEFLKNSGQTN